MQRAGLTLSKHRRRKIAHEALLLGDRFRGIGLESGIHLEEKHHLLGSLRRVPDTRTQNRPPAHVRVGDSDDFCGELFHIHDSASFGAEYLQASVVTHQSYLTPGGLRLSSRLCNASANSAARSTRSTGLRLTNSGFFTSSWRSESKSWFHDHHARSLSPILENLRRRRTARLT